MRGLIVKNQNGYFSIFNDENQFQLCRSRGKLKRSTDIRVGDVVEYEMQRDSEPVIVRVLPRKTLLERPSVANVDQMIIVSAVRSPDLNLYTLDKMILLAEDAGIENIVICINKAEIDPAGADRAVSVYNNAGYPSLAVSVYEKTGLSALSAMLTGHVTAFSGPSGVGKSSLLNHFLGREVFISGDISRKTGRGKNTTRHAELIPFTDHSFLMDTPGYTSLALESVVNTNLSVLFREFLPYLDHCRFNDCLHLKEPDCAVRKAAEEGRIAASRYQSYCAALQEVREASGKRLK